MTRSDIADVARAMASHSNNPRERRWVGVEKILAYLNATRVLGITYERGSHLSLTVFADADYTSKAADRRLISGVAAMLRGVAVCAISRTQYCVILSSTETEYVAMAKGVDKGLLVRPVLSFMQPRVTFPIELFEDNEGAIAGAENHLSSSKSKHIDVRWVFIWDLVNAKANTGARGVEVISC